MNGKLIKLIVLFGVGSMSLAAIFTRMSTMPSVVLAMYRMGMCSLILFPAVLRWNRQELLHIGKKALLSCVLGGVFLGIHFASYMESLKYTSIASSTILVDTEVLFVALALLFLFREKIPRIAGIGIALTLVGSVIIALGDTGGGSNILYGDAMALLGALCSSIYTLIGRGQRKHISNILYTFLVYFTACVVLLVTALVSGQPLTGYSPDNYVYVFGMVLFCTLLGHSVFSWALKYVSAAYISTAKLAEPIFATGMGILLFAELPRMTQVVGGAVVLGGILTYLLAKEETE